MWKRRVFNIISALACGTEVLDRERGRHVNIRVGRSIL
jgi:hypothetical protein